MSLVRPDARSAPSSFANVTRLEILDRLYALVKDCDVTLDEVEEWLDEAIAEMREELS